MRSKLMRRSVILGILLTVFTVAFPGTIRADNVVLAGFDLFETRPGTQVDLAPLGVQPNPQPFKGVPLGAFDFGMGLVATFNTDTIVQRLGDATVANPTVPIEMVALQLMSVNQITLGANTGFLFVTLQSARKDEDGGPGPASTGTITITFGPEAPEGIAHGTFDSTLDVFFDIRFGALDGPIVHSDMLTLFSDDVPWNHFPPFGAVRIQDVNFRLNGLNQLNDFFPVETFAEEKGPVNHVVASATVPEPATIFLLGAGLAGVAAKLRTRGKGKLKD
jgi:hypothetical protein